MRILILYHKTKQNSYTYFILRSLVHLLSEKRFTVHQTTRFSEARQLSISNDNAVIVVELNKRLLSFMDRMNLNFLLKKQRIQQLVQITNGNAFSTRLPSLLVTDDIENSAFKKRALPFEKYAVCSEAAKAKLIANFSLLNENITVIPAAAEDSFQPLAWSEKQSVKMEYAQGKEYFLTSAEGKTAASLLALLKAFSGFKKWQHSNMKFIVFGGVAFKKDKDWLHKFNTYKYREDVVFAGDITEPEYIKLLAGAYLFIHTPKRDADVLPLLQAMKCSTPSLCFTTETVAEYAGAATLLTEADNYEQLSEKLIVLYKDETLRSHLIEACAVQSQHYTKENTLHLLEDALLKKEV